MSYIEIIKQNGLTVYLMEINEYQINDYLDDLTRAEKSRLLTIKHPAKRSEFLASRSLRTKVMGLNDIYYNEHGSPFIEKVGFISLSHTTGLVGLACSSLFNIGIDLELIREKTVRLSPRFVHPSEKLIFDVNSAYDMSLLWSFKETLFKLADRKGVHFATDLIVGRNENGYTGVIHHAKTVHHYQLAVSNFQHYLITCNTTDATVI